MVGGTKLPRPAYNAGPGHVVDASRLLYNFCAYSIRRADELEDAWLQRGCSFSFTEGKHWTRMSEELTSAMQNGFNLPILFADARATDDIICTGLIDKIWLSQVHRTTVHVHHLNKLAHPVPKTRLTIASTGRPIPKNHIRSYVICRTPPWLASVSVAPEHAPDISDMPQAGTEGYRRLVSHYRIERNRNIIRAKKAAVLGKTGRLACEVCKFDFRIYRSFGEGFCEVHHISVCRSDRAGGLGDPCVRVC